MPQETDSRKVKKGFIIASTGIPVSFSNYLFIPPFTPKTITKIILVVNLTAGASMTITISGEYVFPIAEGVEYEIYSNVFTEDGIAEVIGGSFHRYKFHIQNDASTTGRIFAFFEYDYDLIK